MIHKISIENFGSIHDEIVMDLRIPKTAPDLPRFRQARSNPDIRLPTVIALFGPNGAGKTTILRAMTATLAFILNSFKYRPDQAIPFFKPFRHADMYTKPTKVVFEFEATWVDPNIPQLFKYELELLSTPDRLLASQFVRREALYYVSTKNRVRRLFERIRDKPIRISSEFGLRKNDARIENIRDNCSLISHLTQMNIPFALQIFDDINTVMSNIWSFERDTFKIVDSRIADELKNSPDDLDTVNKFLRRCDFGIDKLTIGQTEYGPVAEFHHNGLDVHGLMYEESQGTQNFIRLMPILISALKSGSTVIFDELDNDLHPMLIPEIFDLFHSTETNPHNAQLFITAHNTALFEVLEQEEIYLVEKNADGATNAYGVQDIKGLRREPSLYKQYMLGVLGAVPNIG